MVKPLAGTKVAATHDDDPEEQITGTVPEFCNFPDPVDIGIKPQKVRAKEGFGVPIKATNVTERNPYLGDTDFSSNAHQSSGSLLSALGVSDAAMQLQAKQSMAAAWKKAFRSWSQEDRDNFDNTDIYLSYIATLNPGHVYTIADLEDPESMVLEQGLRLFRGLRTGCDDIDLQVTPYINYFGVTEEQRREVEHTIRPERAAAREVHNSAGELILGEAYVPARIDVGVEAFQSRIDEAQLDQATSRSGFVAFNYVQARSVLDSAFAEIYIARVSTYTNV